MTQKMNNQPPITNNHIGRFMIAVGAVIVNRQTGKTLLVKRSGAAGINEGRWEIVYGRIDQHEDLVDAVNREVREETGIQQLEITKLLRIWHIYRGEKEADKEVYGLTFYCETDQEEITLSSEHTEYQWLTFEEVLTNQDQVLDGTLNDLKLWQEKDMIGPMPIYNLNREKKLY